MHFFLPALTLVFVAAKLFGAISWPWLLVFSPIIAQFGLALATLAFAGLILIRHAKNK